MREIYQWRLDSLRKRHLNGVLMLFSLFHCTNCWEKSWVAGEMRRDLSYWFDGGSTHCKLHSEVINYVTCTLRCPKSPATRLLSNNLFRLTYRKSLKLCISGLDWSLSAHYALTYFFIEILATGLYFETFLATGTNITYVMYKVNNMPRWRHQMETFSALLAICVVNSPVPGEFPAQRPVTRSFDVFFDLRLNKRLSKQSCCWWFKTSPGSLWRHCNAYAVLACDATTALQRHTVSVLTSEITDNSTVHLAQANNKENIKYPHYWPFVRGIHR